MPGASAPAASCAHGSGKMHTSIHSEFTATVRHSRTQWFTAYFALSSEIGLSCLRRLRRLRRKLDTSVEVSGPHDFAVRLSAARQEHIRVHRIPSRVRDDREPPLMWDGTAIISEVIWVRPKQQSFCRQDWTGRIGLILRRNFLRTSGGIERPPASIRGRPRENAN
jgi:hypothetical protein